MLSDVAHQRAERKSPALIVICRNCNQRYKFDESKLGGRAVGQSHCSNCGGPIRIENPALGAVTIPPEDIPALLAQMAGDPAADTAKTAVDAARQSGIGMLPGYRYALAVLAGAAAGSVIPLALAQVTLGREGADVVLDDDEASRRHTELTVQGETAMIRDLGSTNGTFVEGRRVKQHVLRNQSEFRIGSHVLMFIATPELDALEE
jgi:hypothetical protein